MRDERAGDAVGLLYWVCDVSMSEWRRAVRDVRCTVCERGWHRRVSGEWTEGNGLVYVH